MGVEERKRRKAVAKSVRALASQAVTNRAMGRPVAALRSPCGLPCGSLSPFSRLSEPFGPPTEVSRAVSLKFTLRPMAIEH